MQQITLTNAQNIVSTLRNAQAQNASKINVTNIINALQNVTATTFATLTQASAVATSAQHKAQRIYKVTTQNVTLCNSASSLYSNAVNKHVVATQQAQSFTALASNYVMLNNSYSVCALKSNTNKHYLRAVVNKCISVAYYCARTNTLLTKQQVAVYLTASAAKAMLAASTSNTVQHANITHNVTVRNFSLANIHSITVNKQVLSCA